MPTSITYQNYLAEEHVCPREFDEGLYGLAEDINLYSRTSLGSC
jgi:hypothetical protein